MIKVEAELEEPKKPVDAALQLANNPVAVDAQRIADKLFEQWIGLVVITDNQQQVDAHTRLAIGR